MTFKMISWKFHLIFNIVIFVLLQNVNSTDVLNILETYENMTAFKQFRSYLNQVREKHTLEYGEFCHLDDYALLKSMNTPKKSRENVTSLLSRRESDLDRKTEVLRKLLLTGHQFCKFGKMLYCDESTNRCKCGPHQLNNSNVQYVRGSQGNCLWAKDSICFPIYSPPGRHDTCASNTHCLFTNNDGQKIDCDLHNLKIALNQTKKLPTCYCRSELEKELIRHPDFKNVSASILATLNPLNIFNRNINSAVNSKHYSDHKPALLILSSLIFTLISVLRKQ